MVAASIIPSRAAGIDKDNAACVATVLQGAEAPAALHFQQNATNSNQIT
jgi:hypothetical protein